MQEIKEIRKDIENIEDWDKPSFNWNKAYIAAKFAKIAYLHIPQYELENANRANLIPCEEYREFVTSNSKIDIIKQLFKNSDINEYSIVEKPYAVAVVVKINKVVFISLRGTQQLYDWAINLNVSKSRPYADADLDIYFHKGFHRAISSCMYEIYSEVVKRFGKDSTLYVTGHSLGGALAAILHAQWNRNYSPYYHRGPLRDEYLRTDSCYTFGMPRYGNFHAVEHFANPYHIYNKSDIVPTVPPKLLGFDDCFIEYCLTPEGVIDNSHIKGNSFFQFIYRLVTLEGIKEHDIEIYLSRTKNICDAANDMEENNK